MKKLLLCICVFGMLSGLCLAADSSMEASTISAGLWEGQASLKALAGKDAGSSLPAGTPSSLSLTLSMQLFGQGKGALLDIAEQSMYGYPLSNVRWTEKRLHFELDAMGPGQEMTFEGLMTPAGGPQKQAAIIGTVNSKSWKGSFMLSLHVIPESPNEFSFPIKLEDGSLPGTLALPENALSAPANALSAGDAGFMQVPLVILLSGGGPTDRDGNNFNVPGRTNALKQLAQGLAVKGVACFRFDKRGSGEAYWLENPEQVTSLKIHARDAAQVIRQFRSDKRFSRILLAGMNEGAWVGALALNALAEENVFVDGLVVIDASGEEPEDQLTASLSGLGPEVQAEAGRIRQAIDKGQPYDQPSWQLAAFFAPSRSEWVAAWLACHPAAEIAVVKAPVFFIRGEKDMQVSGEAFEKLLDARPSAAARIIPSMNYALKSVKSEEENYDSFTNPAYKVPQSLIDLIAALARVRPLPEGSLPYQRTSP